MGLKPNPLDLPSFNALTLLVGSFDPQNPVDLFVFVCICVFFCSILHTDLYCVWWDVKP